MNIIEFQSAYSKQIIDLILDIQNNEFKVDFALEAQPDIVDIDNFYIKPGGNFLIAVDEGQVVGTIGALKISKSDYAIRKMFVMKSYRGTSQKVAQQLLDNLILFMQANNADRAYLGTIDKYQAAIRFYAKNNFVPIDQNQLPNYFPLAKVDNVFFYKDLKTCKDHGACSSIALTLEQLQKLAPQYPAWQLDLSQPNKITREFQFKTYKQALAFVNQVAELAEEMNHHPDIVLKWGSVRIEYWTHNANGLTVMDFEAAGKINEISLNS